MVYLTTTTMGSPHSRTLRHRHRRSPTHTRHNPIHHLSNQTKGNRCLVFGRPNQPRLDPPSPPPPKPLSGLRYHGCLVRQRNLLVHAPLPYPYRPKTGRHLPRRNRPTPRLVPILSPHVRCYTGRLTLQNAHYTRVCTGRAWPENVEK